MGRPLLLDIHQDELEMNSETHFSLLVKLSLDFPCLADSGLSELYTSPSCPNETDCIADRADLGHR